MKPSLTYYIAAILFAGATGLNLYNEGPNLKTAVGLVFIVGLVWMGIKSRREAHW